MVRVSRVLNGFMKFGLSVMVLVAVCGVIVLAALLVRVVFPDTMVKKEETVQQIACVNGGYLSFVATDVYFSGFASGVVTFKDKKGILVAYQMAQGEYCGWNPSTTKEELIGLAPEALE